MLDIPPLPESTILLVEVWLRAVRRGEIPFEQWWSRCLSLDAELAKLATDDSLPAGPDHARIKHSRYLPI